MCVCGGGLGGSGMERQPGSVLNASDNGMSYLGEPLSLVLYIQTSWSQLHVSMYCIILHPLPPQPLLVDQRTWPFPPLDHTVSLSPGTHPLMMGELSTP